MKPIGSLCVVAGANPEVARGGINLNGLFCEVVGPPEAKGNATTHSRVRFDTRPLGAEFWSVRDKILFVIRPPKGGVKTDNPKELETI